MKKILIAIDIIDSKSVKLTNFTENKSNTMPILDFKNVLKKAKRFDSKNGGKYAVLELNQNGIEYTTILYGKEFCPRRAEFCYEPYKTTTINDVL